MPVKALAVDVSGIVQGVGFRPFVYRLARESGLTGWVLNSSDGVHCVVEGRADAVDAFPALLEARAPAMAVIERLVVSEVEPAGFSAFEIRTSDAETGTMTLVSPDIATCPECARELADPSDRRFGYAFTNCTNCGPRFTIIDDIPYDRPMTTMRDFPMCERCAAEYADPEDRRFHAQPNACFTCGPRLYLNQAAPGDWEWEPAVETVPRPLREEDTERARSDALLDAAAELLRSGGILAIKGLGGFHLACDATNEAAVQILRERKRRWGKPLAIMVPDLDTARAYCDVDQTEAELLTGAVRPIVLLSRLQAPARRQTGTATSAMDATGDAGSGTSGVGQIAANVVGDLTEIGVMLPYTPLHHLLLSRLSRPLVMTSGNLSDEPIATANPEALERLRDIADAFLLHDRDIYSRYDDSVVRVVGDTVEMVRRSRGYAPFPLPLPFSAVEDILAVGPEQKNTFTLLTGSHAFVSQHIGDLENAETLAAFEETFALYRRLFRVQPRVVAHDMHPEYLSTKWALAGDLPTVAVQHHHAHIVSVAAEHGVSEPVVGIAFDGTGYGTDGHIWGGEVLTADWTGFERFAHLRYVPMPGGSAAIRRPARMALGTLIELGLVGHQGAAPLLRRLDPGEERTLTRMVERRVNCPLTSSMGRLFDSVSALVGIADDARYEGEAAILLEAAAEAGEYGSYEFGFLPAGVPGEPGIIDPAPVLTAILDDIESGIPAGVISARFHRAVTACIVTVAKTAAESANTRYVALAGGVFLNRRVFGGAVRELHSAGLSPLTHVRLPVNDAAVSFGQAVVAWAGRQELRSGDGT